MELTIKITEEMMQQAMENALASFETEIGMTIKECVEKQVAKKPVDKIMYLECPNCGDAGILDCLYCSCCGQKIDWKEDGDNDAEND